MSQTSPRLALPLIAPSQAQKHVTHNEAVVLLDGLVQLTLHSVGAQVPPASGADGEAHALGPAPTGLWEGQGGRVAIRSNGGWVFASPAEGWRAWDLAGGAALRHDGAGWGPDAPDMENLAGVGIGTGFDAVNRLSVASDAVLMSHAGAGMQLKINKAGPSETGALLFQSDWSGRAEMGLAGSDAFEVKVSPDGGAWATGMRIDPAGILEAPGGLSIGGGAALGSADAGDWSPVLTCEVPAAAAQQTATGRFVRIGPLVHASADIVLDDPGAGGSGRVRIDGLPAAGGGLAAGSASVEGIAWPTSDRVLRIEGSAVVPGRSAGGISWADLGPGDAISLAVTYIAG